MEDKAEKKGVTLGDAKEWFKDHKVDDVYKALDDFANDVRRLFEAMCVLYEENKVPLSLLGTHVSLKVESTVMYGPDSKAVAPGLGVVLSSDIGVRPAGDGDNEEDGDDGQKIS